MDRPAHPPRDLAVAAAIDRVLAAEREGEAAIADAARQAAECVEQARAFRRHLLDRSQARITALHARAVSVLEDEAARTHRRILRIRRQQAASSPPDCIDSAIAALALQLTGTDSQGSDDD